MSNDIEKIKIPKTREVWLKNIIERADQQLEIIKPSLEDFFRRVIEDRPDEIIFLDKGARVFGTPILKLLKEMNLSKIPKIKFFNDDYLKGLYLDGELNKGSIEEELGDIRSKKVFFFDETYSQGKGAAMLVKVKKALNNENIFYFALTKDENAGLGNAGQDFEDENKIAFSEHMNNLQDVYSDKNFIIYNNDIPVLFSKDAAELYVTDLEIKGKMRTVHYGKTLKNTLEVERRRTKRKTVNVPSAEEFDSSFKIDETRRRNFQAVAEVKKKIYQTLLTLNI